MKKLTPETCPFDPIEDNLIVRKLKTEKTAGGIVLPDAGMKQRIAVRGEVLAVGPGRVLENGALKPVCSKPGEVILFSSMAGLELGEELRQELKRLEIIDVEDSNQIIMLRQADVICTVKRK